MNKLFKHGDRIKISGSAHSYGKKYNYRSGVVVSMCYGKYEINIDGFSNHYSTKGNFYFDPDELVPETYYEKRVLVGDFQTGFSYVDKAELEAHRLEISKQREKFTDMRIPIKQTNFAIKKVIFNNPCTIVIWEDGTKTIVKCSGEHFDAEKGLAMAISKKALGNKSDYYKEMTKFIPNRTHNQSFNEGDFVLISNHASSYDGKYNNNVGIVKRFAHGRYKVVIPGTRNICSDDGYFYFYPDELDLQTLDECVRLTKMKLARLGSQFERVIELLHN